MKVCEECFSSQGNLIMREAILEDSSGKVFEFPTETTTSTQREPPLFACLLFLLPLTLCGNNFNTVINITLQKHAGQSINIGHLLPRRLTLEKGSSLVLKNNS